jgi:hypothetical protein
VLGWIATIGMLAAALGLAYAKLAGG